MTILIHIVTEAIGTFVSLFVSIPQLKLTYTHCWVRGEGVQPFPHTCMYCQTVQCCPSLLQLNSDFRDFNNGVCHVLKTAIGDRNPDS